MREYFYCLDCGTVTGWEEPDTLFEPGDWENFVKDPDNGTGLCDDCFHEKYQKCALCGEIHEKVDAFTTKKDIQLICDYCLDTPNSVMPNKKLFKLKKFRASWERTDLTAIVEAESVEDVYEMCGTFEFEQGGRGNMPLPAFVEEIE